MDITTIFLAKYLLHVSAVVAVVFLCKQPREKQRKILVLALTLFSLSYLVAKIAGYFFFSPRPFVVGNFTPLIPHAPNNGFPSDHTLLAAAVALVVFHFQKRLGLLLLFFAFLVGLARVLAGVHHWTDIFGGLAIALTVYVIVEKFLEIFFQNKNS